MSFMYPRTIDVTRPGAQQGVGAQGYSGLSPRNETPVVSGVPASIQKSGNAANSTGLPSDVKLTNWNVFAPLYALQAGLVEDRDIITDDLGRRFKVVTAYVDSMGANITAQLLET